jgi:hypothetical protein
MTVIISPNGKLWTADNPPNQPIGGAKSQEKPLKWRKKGSEGDDFGINC